jgi:hypothetical protein
MTLLLTAQLCLPAGCYTWPWASSSRMLTPGTRWTVSTPSRSRQLVQGARGSSSFELAQAILHLSFRRMTPLLTAQLCLLAGCRRWRWALAPCTLATRVFPDGDSRFRLTLAFASGFNNSASGFVSGAPQHSPAGVVLRYLSPSTTSLNGELLYTGHGFCPLYAWTCDSFRSGATRLRPLLFPWTLPAHQWMRRRLSFQAQLRLTVTAARWPRLSPPCVWTCDSL